MATKRVGFTGAFRRSKKPVVKGKISPRKAGFKRRGK